MFHYGSEELLGCVTDHDAQALAQLHSFFSLDAHLRASQAMQCCASPHNVEHSHSSYSLLKVLV